MKDRKKEATIMTVEQVNAAIARGRVITVCPFDVFTNQVSATVLHIASDWTVTYQVDGCESKVRRQVSYAALQSIVVQARHSSEKEQ